MTKKNEDQGYIVTTESDSCETIMDGEGVIIVPISTLDDERKQALEDGECEKLLKHGGEFPGIYLTELLEILEEEGRLEGILEQCRQTRVRLDAKKDKDDE